MKTRAVHRHRRLTDTGFTLIELMITVAIVAVLAAIALPSYRSYVLRSHRSDAMATLTQDQAILERCYAQNYSYSQACASLPAFPQTSSQTFYSIALTSLTPTTYTLTATALGSQTADTMCASMAIDQTSNKIAFDSNGTTQPSCWSR